MRKLLLFCLMLFVTGVCSAYALETSVELENVRQEIAKQNQAKERSAAKAKELKKEVSNIQKQIVAAAKSVTEYESSLNELEEQAKDLEKSQALLKENMSKRTKQLTILISGLEVLATRPISTVFGAPFEFKDALNSAEMTKSTLTILDREAEYMQQEMERLSGLRIATRAKYAQIKSANTGLQQKQKELNKLIATKNAQQRQQLSLSQTAAKKQAELSKKAKNLEELLEAIEKKKKKEEKAARKAAEAKAKENTPKTTALDINFEKAKGFLPLPAAGEIISSFGEVNQIGMHNKGITILTRRGAQIISPYDGKVLFSGGFKGYGNLIIIEHSKSYYTLLSGIDKLEAEEGQSLLAGEPIGTMSQEDSGKLYMEIRKDGNPINPSPWLALK